MSTGTITTRLARPSDFDAFHGRRPDHAVRAWVLEVDGEVVGMAGWRVAGEHLVVFSDVKPGVAKMTVWRKAKQLMAMIDFPAFCECTETSGPMLLRLGWRHVAGNVYKYEPR